MNCPVWLSQRIKRVKWICKGTKLCARQSMVFRRNSRSHLERGGGGVRDVFGEVGAAECGDSAAQGYVGRREVIPNF